MAQIHVASVGKKRDFFLSRARDTELSNGYFYFFESRYLKGMEGGAASRFQLRYTWLLVDLCGQYSQIIVNDLAQFFWLLNSLRT